MILTKSDILACIEKGEIEIDPFEPKHVGPNSVDLLVSPQLLVYGTHYPPGSLGELFHPGGTWLDARGRNKTHEITIREDGFTLMPGILYLGSTVERTHTPHHVPYIGGRSSTGRLGIQVHSTAGFGDIGFNGTWTLEISVVHPVRIYPNMRLLQMWLFMPSSAGALYNGRYQNQQGPVPSKIHED